MSATPSAHEPDVRHVIVVCTRRPRARMRRCAVKLTRSPSKDPKNVLLLHRPMAKPKSRSCAAYPLQRFLYSTLDCFPTTAGSAQFCLLCCQPEPVPESLPARPPSLTRGCPCRLPVWSGQSIHMVHRTYSGPRHSISHTPFRGTERCDPPQI